MSLRVDQTLTERLRAAPDPEAIRDWPVERLASLRDAGVFRWGLPEEYGGLPVSDQEMLGGYFDLSRLCLTTAFILTQRNAACHRIAACGDSELRQRLLPDLCRGQTFATVGISHLSTSRQHWARPSVMAVRKESGFELSGEAPWVTGAKHADLLVTGGTLENGDQIMAAVPIRRDGVSVGEPMKLLALNESMTGSVVLSNVRIGSDEILIGPCPQVMKVGTTGGTGSLTTTAVALGAAARTLDDLGREASKRTELQPTVQSLRGDLDRLQDRLHQAAGNPSDASGKETAEGLRLLANSMAVRAAQALVATAKGAGYVAGHPAERAIREAMFFHVWSCPPAVTAGTLTELVSARF